MRGHDEYFEASAFGMEASPLLSLLLPIITLAGRQDLDISGLHITADHRLAFVVNDRFATCSINGQNVRYLGTASAQDVTCPSLAKDTHFVLFSDNFFRLRILDLLTGKKRVILSHVSFAFDQKRNLLFTCQRDTPNPRVDRWMIDRNGGVSHRRLLAKFRYSRLGGPQLADSGQTLMFEEAKIGKYSQDHLISLSLRTLRRRIIKTQPHECLGDWAPSPRGTFIYDWLFEPDRDFAFYRHFPSGKEIRISPRRSFDRYPVVDQKSGRILFRSSDETWTMSLDGSHRRPLFKPGQLRGELDIKVAEGPGLPR